MSAAQERFEIRGDTLIVPSWEWNSGEGTLLGEAVKCSVWHDCFGFTFTLPSGAQVACSGRMDTDALPFVNVATHFLPPLPYRRGEFVWDATPNHLLNMLASLLEEPTS